jgi:hypothetical protein
VKALVRGLIGLVAAFGVETLAGPAGAAEPAPSDWRVLLGWSGGGMPGGGEWPWRNTTLGLRCERRVVGRLWLGTELAGSYAFNGPDVEAGYTRVAVDLGLAPRFSLLRPQLPDRPVGVYLVAPFGLSRPFIGTPGRRAFQERVHGHLGWHAGGRGGAEFLSVDRRGHVWTLAIEAGYRLHVASARTTFTVAGVTTHEDRRLVDHELGVMVAVGLAL